MYRLILWKKHSLNKNLCAIPKSNEHEVEWEFEFPTTNSNFKPLESFNKDVFDFFEIQDITNIFKNTQSQSNGRKMALNKYVKNIYIMLNGNNIFITAICEAEMTISKEYLVKTLLNPEEEPSITFSDCQCKAGHGPVAICKHVSAVLNCIEGYARNGTYS